MLLELGFVTEGDNAWEFHSEENFLRALHLGRPW
jgi:hypothetical protein